MENNVSICTKSKMIFCKVYAHFCIDGCYNLHRKNPPIHYIVFATSHKKKYLLQKRQPIPLSLLLYKNKSGIVPAEGFIGYLVQNH